MIASTGVLEKDVTLKVRFFRCALWVQRNAPPPFLSFLFISHFAFLFSYLRRYAVHAVVASSKINYVMGISTPVSLTFSSLFFEKQSRPSHLIFHVGGAY